MSVDYLCLKLLTVIHNFQLAARPGSPESLQQLIEIAKNPANAANLTPSAVGKEDIARTPRDKKVLDSILFSLA